LRPFIFANLSQAIYFDAKIVHGPDNEQPTNVFRN